MNLTVIIPTHNRAGLLRKVLESLLVQTFPQNDFEVIVADNGSTDATRKLCDEFKKKFVHFKYCYDETPGLHVGRHRGLKEAESDILVYGDDDIEALPTWLQGVWAGFQNTNTALVGGNNYPLYETGPPAWVARLWRASKNSDGFFFGYFSVLDFGSIAKEIYPCYVIGCNFSIRKNILLEAGGFHPDGMPRELIKFRGDGESAISAYVLKKGYKTIFHPQASVKHYVSRARMSREYLKRRSFNQGVSDSYSSLRSGNPPCLRKQCNIPMIDIVNSFSGLHIFKALRLGREKLSNILQLSLSPQLTSAFYEGYNSHQREYMKNAQVRVWVHKENYY